MYIQYHNIIIYNIFSTNTYPSESHRVKGHSHIPLKSGLLISLFINSSGVKPSRPSHSGTYPASGATRSGVVVDEEVSGFSMVENRLDVRRDEEGGANAVQVLASSVAIMVIIFMVF